MDTPTIVDQKVHKSFTLNLLLGHTDVEELPQL